ncbi:hypothetical protein E6C76_14050 [Pseudothauera nasutitermitis]|uniref:Type VI secretion system tip protein VgrG n=1 Tax=Pseudothauera nasutitermitis TaxID=2565930 RepID=A0A4S4AUQ9_9RHOO|nr:contractile injection system protein, VgrG/Pvc8 family [Pseudothauera nasutitermitis]THF63707.1 hypothetical protein E6C76_14050 [Pseudothauera nasutitermitis]
MNAPLEAVATTRVAPLDQPLLFQHCRIEMPRGTVMGENVFRLVSFQGQESVSDLFEYQLELHGDSDPAGEAIDFSQIIGRPITVGVAGVQFDDRKLAHQAFLKALDGGGEAQSFALFNGIVASFAIDRPGVYHITMRPMAWRMTLTNRYRILRQMNIREALATLCREHRVEANFDGLAGEDNLASTRTQDWMQAGESDLDFIHRLMARAHIFFYFEHRAGGHRMVFANRAVYPAARPGDAPLRYTFSGEDELGLHEADVVTQYAYQQSMASTGVRGVFTLQREAWDARQPAEPLAGHANFRADSGPDTGELPFHQYKIVQYGYCDSEVRHYAQATDQALRSASLRLDGASRCPFLRAGHRFSMVAAQPGVRPELDGRAFVLTQVQHSSTLDGEYQNQFGATVAGGLLSSAGLQDTQQGVVLATVTSAAGDDAVRDWPYYVPDGFSSGRSTLTDTQGVQAQLHAKGVYVRFSTDTPDTPPVWVKLAAHMQTIPEVGSNVWVTRANDESELPEIQNMVQADGSRTITDSGWTAHSQVGNSYSTSYGDSRSVRFGRPWSRAAVDAAVGLVEKAYARGVFRDAGYARGGNYSYAESEHKEQGMLGESWAYGSNYSYAWGKESKSFSATGRSYHESVTGKCDPALASTEQSDPDALAAVQASKSVVYGDTYSSSVAHGRTKSVSTFHGEVVSRSEHHGDVASTTTVTGTSDNTSTHSGKVTSVSTIHADSENTSTVTGTATNRSTHAIVHNFTAIGAQSSSTAIGASNSNDAIGVSNSNSVTGVRNANALLGVAADVSLSGSVNNVSLTGAAVSANITGSHNGMNVTGSSNNVNVTGNSSSVDVTGESTRIEVLGSGLTLSVRGSTVGIDISGPSIQIPVVMLVV